ncbi:hypothetical protein [Halomonas sp. hl-4]|uniref:hypothetical protein n=1 Tax=Halomonas sp. hl-4 TaxID=1761789 RepID=UPI000BB7E31A|nr:hypothetical protein [Halomonas sp. hl-4]SNY97899.1 hypothetical protein SAMN04488142_2506 [Halomonas sp. hl-4]
MAPPFRWIDTNDHGQLEWICGYIARRSTKGTLPVSWSHILSTRNNQAVAERLMELPNEIENRETSRLMKGAWQTHQYRRQNGKQVSFQLPIVTLKQLDALSKRTGYSKVQTLSQLISNAVEDQRKDAAKLKRERESFNDSLKKYQVTAQQAEQVYCDAVDGLLSVLAEEIDHRCRYEERFGELDSLSLDSGSIDEYDKLVKKRVEKIEPILEKLKMRRADIGQTMRKRMEEKIRVHEREDYVDESAGER